MIGTQKRRRFKILFLAVASSTRHDERYFRQAMIGRWNFFVGRGADAAPTRVFLFDLALWFLKTPIESRA